MFTPQKQQSHLVLFFKNITGFTCPSEVQCILMHSVHFALMHWCIIFWRGEGFLKFIYQSKKYPIISWLLHSRKQNYIKQSVPMCCGNRSVQKLCCGSLRKVYAYANTIIPYTYAYNLIGYTHFLFYKNLVFLMSLS